MKCKVLNPMCGYYARGGEIVCDLPRRQRLLTVGVEVLQLPPTARLAKTTTLLRPVHASQNPKATSQGIARTSRKLWQPTMRQCRGNVEATVRLRAGGNDALCAGDASGEEDTEPRERQERQDQGLTSGDWGGLGNYLWELTLERGNFV